MKKEIIIDSSMRAKIEHSQVLSESDKKNFLAHILYFTESEKQDLLEII